MASVLGESAVREAAPMETILARAVAFNKMMETNLTQAAAIERKFRGDDSLLKEPPIPPEVPLTPTVTPPEKPTGILGAIAREQDLTLRLTETIARVLKSLGQIVGTS